MRDTRKRFKLKDRILIEKLIKDGVHLGDIADHLNAARSGIYREVRKNGGIENYSALKAQYRAETARSQAQGNSNPTLREEINTLKLQIQTLFDLIKEMR